MKSERSELTKNDEPTKTNINERLARRGTKIFGSMWTFYAFVIYGVLGAIFVGQQARLLYWSNWIQLWSMPLLMVGGLVLERASEKRAQATYDLASEVSRQAEEIQAHLERQDQHIANLTRELASAIKVISDLRVPQDIS